MNSAALGLTCQDAFQIFSQNETLILQKQVNDLTTQILQYKPSIAANAINPVQLVQKIKTWFDLKNSTHERRAPVRFESEAADPLYTANDCIWCGLSGNMETNFKDFSLRGIIENELLCVLGEVCYKYCVNQSYAALNAIRIALVSAYIACGWDSFSLPHLQEIILWKALVRHFGDMRDCLNE
mgnify:CR=1 FL=1